MPKLNKDEVVVRTSEVVKGWLSNRLKKFQEPSHETMAINPFLAPVLMALHSHTTFEDLAELLLGGHFMIGHATGFGKLIDEKLLPLFGSTKLNKAFRKIQPFSLPVFSEVDHIIGHGGETASLLSLKASRWTIQLTMAKQMNSAFANLLNLRATGVVKFDKIVVGVIYGTQESLTDKFKNIILGTSSGEDHGGINVTERVEVKAGKQFWTWINGDEEETQDWVLAGVRDAIDKSQPELANAKKYLEENKRRFSDSFKKFVDDKGGIDWPGILHQING